MTDTAKQVRQAILRISGKSGHGHIPTCFSIVEMLLAVYSVMRHDPKNPKWPERDVFILSKGHAALGLYCTLAHYGYFPLSEVDKFGAFKSNFGCHADRFKVPGVEASTGSLGHGIGLAVGMALAFKINKSSRKVYTIVGDGEATEGTVWESIMVATNMGLPNLTVLYDNNNSQVRCLQIRNPAERFASFGADTVTVDGHSEELLKEALRSRQNNVKVIVANTTKGYGCKTLVDNMLGWHRRSPKDDELAMLSEELNASAV